jgi:hypothetical protein
MIDRDRLVKLQRMMGDAERIYYPAGGPWITHGEICDTLSKLLAVYEAADTVAEYSHDDQFLNLKRALAACSDPEGAK